MLGGNYGRHGMHGTSNGGEALAEARRARSLQRGACRSLQVEIMTRSRPADYAGHRRRGYVQSVLNDMNWRWRLQAENERSKT